MRYRKSRRGGGGSAPSFLRGFGGSVSGLLALILPFGLLIFGGIYLFKWIKGKGGLMALIGSLTGIDTLGESQSNIETNNALLNMAKDDLDKKGVQVTAMHYSLANSIETLLNQLYVAGAWHQLTSHVVPKEWQVSVLQILKNIKLQKDVAGVFVAYGSRELSNRRFPVLGFLFDSDSINLVQTINKYFDGKEKEQALKIVNDAIAVYLN